MSRPHPPTTADAVGAHPCDPAPPAWAPGWEHDTDNEAGATGEEG